MLRLIFIATVLNCFLSIAQNEDDALRYSFTGFGGSARSASTAGSFGAIGGDYSFVSLNPAGLARIKKHQFSVGYLLDVPMVTTAFYGTETQTTNVANKVSNASYIKAYNLDPKKFNNWYGVQMGLGYNRIQNFSEKIRYTGELDSSMLHSFIKSAKGTLPDNIYSTFPFDAGLAYDTYAIDPGLNNTYITDFTSGTAIHDRTITRKGGVGEYSFSMSGNYGNKFFIGGALNISRFKFSDNFEHKETFTDTTLWIRDIRYMYELAVEGWGIGGRIGMIILPVDWIRIGLSVQTPTRINLSDSWSANMFTDSDDGLKYVADENIPYGKYDYRIQTPMRANASIGLVFKKIGCLGVDVEYVDYSTATLSSKKFSEAPYSFIAENNQVTNIYRAAINIKTGFEIRIKSQYYLRGGYALYNSPYKPDKGNLVNPTQYITAGAGYNFGNWYVDFAVITRQAKSMYYAYDPTLMGSNVSVLHKGLSFNLTAGIRID